MAFKERYTDGCTREQLPQGQIQAAIVDELAYFNELVWVGVSLVEAKQDAAGNILNGRWVLSNTSGLVNPD